jgi:phospholipid-binding lipoprotein MlaA
LSVLVFPLLGALAGAATAVPTTAPIPVSVAAPAPQSQSAMDAAVGPASDQNASAAPSPAATSGPESATPTPTPTPVAPAQAASPQPEVTDIVVTARARTAADPLEGVNTLSFSTVQSVDKALVGPVSLAYKRSIPEPVRDGLRNALDNLQEPVVFLNFLLQLKPGKAVETLGRFAINSTVGAAGLFDVAKKRPFNLPRRPNGFAFTLGYYGVKPGPFLFLPLIGPTTLRDLLGRAVDLTLLPTALGKPFNKPIYSLSTTTIRSLDERAQNDDQLTKFRATSDPYAALRDAYLKNRQAEIDELRGKHPAKAAPPLP